MRFYQLASLILKEASDDTSKTKFRETTIDSPEITKAIESVSAKTGVPADLLRKDIEKELEKIVKLQKYSPLMYEDMSKNAVETAAFNLIWSSKKYKDVSKNEWDLDNEELFNKLLELFDRIELDLTSTHVMPFRFPKSSKRIVNLNPIFIPNYAFPQYSNKKSKRFIKTAAVSQYGQFFFNKQFMEALLFYGSIIDVQPTGRLYERNGGPFPNNFCYIEFLIMHEIFHWTFEDIRKGNKYKKYSHLAKNLADDYANNALLVSLGYCQIPVGFFSSKLNYTNEQYNTRIKLLRAVATELKKVPKNLKAYIQKQAADVHESEEEAEWSPQVGDIVFYPGSDTNGKKFLKIIKVNPVLDLTKPPTYETKEVTKEEAEAKYGGKINIDI